MPLTKYGKRAIQVIREHPEAFEALLEYERTKKLPKLSYKERANFTIDSTLLRKFRGYCKEKGLNMSRVVERGMKDEIGLK
jgi:hypothetical protein